MIRMNLAVCLALLSTGAYAEPFNVDAGHTEIGFTVKHLMLSNVRGSFNTFKGVIEYDIAGKELKSIAGTIDTGSIDTNNDKRDTHLKNQDFFNVSTFPEMQFVSTAIEKTGDMTYRVTGVLTVLGVERKVVLPVTVAGPIDDPWGNKRIGLGCETSLNRRDLGITNSPAAVISDEVNIEINAEATFKPS